MTAASTTSTADRPGSTAPEGSSQVKRMLWTHLGTNSWLAEFPNSGCTVLCDPWLTGELTFAAQRWLFEGKKGLSPPLDMDALVAKADFVLLSQGLPDHAHEPTLRRLPKDIPVVASPAGAEVAARCGLKQVYELDHGQSREMCGGKLRIRATAGALVGPPWSHRENGFLVEELDPKGVSMLYDPHCDFNSASFKDVSNVDVLLTPVVSQIIGFFPLVQGTFWIERLAKQVQPKIIIPLENSSFPATGLLSKLIWQVDNESTLPDRLQAAGLKGVCVEYSKPPGQALDLRL